jgi:phage terminase large subunit GpA-like protein
VPVLQLNVDRLKDMARASLEREEAGPGSLHTADWMEREWFEEALAENRDDKGRWKKEKGARNESLDLLGYARAASISLGAEKVRWDSPPSWCAEWGENENVLGGKPVEDKRPKPSTMFDNATSGDSWLR